MMAMLTWLARLLERQTKESVHCQVCETPLQATPSVANPTTTTLWLAQLRATSLAFVTESISFNSASRRLVQASGLHLVKLRLQLLRTFFQLVERHQRVVKDLCHCSERIGFAASHGPSYAAVHQLHGFLQRDIYLQHALSSLPGTLLLLEEQSTSTKAGDQLGEITV